MKKIFILFLLVLFTNCFGPQDKKVKLFKQRIDSKFGGSVTPKNISEFKKINDSVFEISFEMFNYITNKELKAFTKVVFNKQLDSIISTHRIKTQIKSEGEWIDMNF